MDPLKGLFLGILLLFSAFLSAQYKVTFVLDSFPVQQPSDKIFIAGNFNNWNPGSENYLVKKLNDKTGITIDLPRGMIEYKFSRGSWESAETDHSGNAMGNRKAEIKNDTLIHVAIENWADHFPHAKKISTAGKNVHILDAAFHMPQLNRYRRIWIYLPLSYAAGNKSYPVLYMQDGQNVFDAATSFAGEWGVDESLDTLGVEVRECIVVAVDNGGDKRINEYSPYDMQKYGKGEGREYVDFLVHTLKPYVDHHFRSKKNRANTFIAGSSLGALISFYAMLHYPGVFGGAGIFSPAFWIAPGLKQDIADHGKKVNGRIWFYAGKKETDHMVSEMQDIFQKMKEHSQATMEIVISEEGRHNESDWRKEFPEFYRWIFRGMIKKKN